MATWPEFFHHSVFMASGLAVLASLYFGGFGPGLLATALTLAGAMYFVLEPTGSFAISQADDRLRTAIQFTLLVVASMLGGVLKQERRRAATREAQLRASEGRYRVLLEQASDGIFVAGRDGRFQVVNRRACEMLGYTAGELLRLSVEDILDPEDLARQPVRWKELDSAEPVMFERLMVRRDGTRLPVEVSARLTRWGQVQAIVRDITERRRAEEALRVSESELRGLVGALSDVVVIVDRQGVIRKIPAADPRVLPMPAERLVGMQVGEVFGPEAGAEMVGYIDRALVTDEAVSHDVRLDIRGREVVFRATVSPMNAEQVVVLSRDITAERATEARLETARELLAQSQKLEAVGRLAGGVAHDFNNLLTVISGNAELALQSLPAGDPRREAIEEVRRAGERAAGLTRQLLAFSRRQVLESRPLDLGHVVRDIERMLRRLIPEDVELALELDAAGTPVFADRGQLEQVVLNLAVNARDAMPGGGRLTLRTRSVRVGEDEAALGPPAPGDYVVLEVEDGGIGMDEATQARMFEPFFTTKPVGQGTGLGLSMVHGIVEQSRGALRVRSAPGEGTTIAVLLPRLTGEPGAAGGAPSAPGREGAPRATILLVEDETPVRQLGRRVLERLGHEVLEADGPARALELEASHAGPIDLLITDVVMPGMNGRELAGRLVARRPDLRVLFLSGYVQPDLLAADGGLPHARAMLKPFTVDALGETVGRMLHGAGA